MSIKVMSRVWAQSTRKDGELLVMLALADFANDGGESWPKIPTLAQKARLTERQTRRVLNTLEAAGEIRRVRSNGGRHRPNHYFISLAENPDKITLKTLQGKNYPEMDGTKTLTPMSGVLNRHGTVKRETRKERASRPRGKSSDPMVKEILSHFLEAYRRYVEKPYHVARGKDERLINDLLRTFSAEELKDYVVRFFELDDQWVEKAGRTVGVFHSQINKLASNRGNGSAEKPAAKDLGDGFVEFDGRRMSRKDYERRYAAEART
ncbi:MAG: helix-turn-helix domain-containing protein [Deltaproteobacteria bacterium]|nr:helix-turn-helix domain-containing protein [Deltaproteobacteria bacterium]